jgi:hypothetical protein
MPITRGNNLIYYQGVFAMVLRFNNGLHPVGHTERLAERPNWKVFCTPRRRPRMSTPITCKPSLELP